MKVILLTILACLAAAVCAGPGQSLGESKLLQAMRSTNALQQNNPARSIECFQYYSEIFDQQLQQYEQQYQACENSSQLQLATLDWLYETKLSGLSNNAQSACQLIQNCDNLNDTGSSLACYAQVGAEDAKVMYNISGAASQYNSEFNQKKQVIEYQLEDCSNEARRAYEVDTEQTYVRLQACLMGTEPVPSTTTAGTSASPVTGTTTPVPSTTGNSTADTSSSPVISTTTPVPSTTVRSTKAPKTTTTKTTTTTDIPATTTTTGAYTTSSIPVSKSTTIATTSTSRRPISSIKPTTTTDTSTATPSPSSSTSSHATPPVPLDSTTASLISTTLPVPLSTTSALVTVKPTASAAPSLSSDLKKLLHSLLH
ncbi:hypothetical protein AWZ03_003412 [Drosophila navojoa]|uniref:Protein TsetseEP domain-containing protein n=1 Tax=Drosophila navojoa TaxID=7232 RepID=A0A484BMV4_DRONA|nr:flocculation protein FLO11 [Drosophila navojoa]TDG50196.1 hypothetical protein AWZ03_003412 [Drosophila navojoa]